MVLLCEIMQILNDLDSEAKNYSEYLIVRKTEEGKANSVYDNVLKKWKWMNLLISFIIENSWNIVKISSVLIQHVL